MTPIYGHREVGILILIICHSHRFTPCIISPSFNRKHFKTLFMVKGMNSQRYEFSISLAANHSQRKNPSRSRFHTLKQGLQNSIQAPGMTYHRVITPSPFSKKILILAILNITTKIIICPFILIHPLYFNKKNFNSLLRQLI